MGPYGPYGPKRVALMGRSGPYGPLLGTTLNFYLQGGRLHAFAATSGSAVRWGESDKKWGILTLDHRHKKWICLAHYFLSVFSCRRTWVY